MPSGSANGNTRHVLVSGVAFVFAHSCRRNIQRAIVLSFSLYYESKPPGTQSPHIRHVDRMRKAFKMATIIGARSRPSARSSTRALVLFINFRDVQHSPISFTNLTAAVSCTDHDAFPCSRRLSGAAFRGKGRGRWQVQRYIPMLLTAAYDSILTRYGSTEVSLNTYTDANHWLILIFFPKAWSFICPTEIKAFSARMEEFLYSRSCAVVFASTDSEHCLKAWNNTSEMEGGLGGVHTPLISDCNHKMSKDYGIYIEEEGVAQRALFIIDPKGIIRCILVNDADVGRSVDEAQRILDALMFKDEFGEGCPIDWKKGDKGIEIAAPNRTEGRLDLSKKSWSEWARPKLTRAWSATSQRSVVSGPVGSRLRADSNDRLFPNGITSNGSNSGYHSAYSSGQQSPMVSPTSANPMEALMEQRMENLKSALQNQSVGVPN